MVDQIAECQKHYECQNETAEEVEAENERKVNWRNNPNRSITTELPTIAEINVAICRLKLELLTYGAEEVAPVLRPLLLEIWKTNKIPSDWKEGLIIPKKCELSRCKNWRGITFLNSVVKVLAFIILERVAPVLNTTLRTEQNDFWPKRSCVEHMNSLHIIIEQSVEWRSPLYFIH